MHLNSELLFRKYAGPLFTGPMRVLEIGPDNNPSTFEKIARSGNIVWETLDIAAKKFGGVTYVTENEYMFPIADDIFDVVLSANVMEHVKKPWVWIKELARVCKPGGRVITIVPVSWPYHEAPVDCWRVYPEGMKALYEEAGLKVELCRFESLEPRGRRRAIPGQGQMRGRGESLWRRLIKDALRWPTPYAFDTISIGTK